MRNTTTIAMERLRLSRLLAVSVSSVFLLVSLLSGCGTSGPEGGEQEARFWTMLRIDGGEEAEYFDMLAEMKASADSVVVGTFKSFTHSRIIQGDAEEDVVVYGKAELAIAETIAGKSPGESVALEFLLPVLPDEAENAISDLQGSLPSGDLVVFLREKRGEREAGLFRVVNSTGLWAETNRAELDLPLAAQPPDESGIYSDELKGVDSLAELVEVIQTTSA